MAVNGLHCVDLPLRNHSLVVDWRAVVLGSNGTTHLWPWQLETGPRTVAETYLCLGSCTPLLSRWSYQVGLRLSLYGLCTVH